MKIFKNVDKLIEEKGFKKESENNLILYKEIITDRYNPEYRVLKFDLLKKTFQYEKVDKSSMSSGYDLPITADILEIAYLKGKELGWY